MLSDSFAPVTFSCVIAFVSGAGLHSQPSHQIKRHDAARALGLGLGFGLGIPIIFMKEIPGLLVPAIRQSLPRRPVVLGFFLSLHAFTALGFGCFGGPALLG